MNVIEISKIDKSFKKNKVLENLNMSVPENSIYGFVGKNGTGKTTTMKLILGLLGADSGEILVYGEKVHYGDSRTNRYIGYLPDVPEFYNYMNIREYLSLCGEISGLSYNEIKKRGDELTELVGLSGIKKKIGSFSRGMKQRLGIAQALIGNPKILICDEPTSALDPIGRKDILDILSSIKNSTTVIFSTHILSDVERICDTVGILDKGTLKFNGSLEQIKKLNRKKGVIIEFKENDDIKKFLELEKIKSIKKEITKTDNIVNIKLDDIDKQALFVISCMAENNIIPIRFEFEESTLENLFMEVTEK